MGEGDNKSDKIKDTAEAITNLVKVIPIYQDSIQPAAKQVGKSLETVAKSVNLALAPIKGLVWSFEKLQKFIDFKISEKLKNTPADEIETPKGNIVVPALQALSYSGDDPELQELFANLIAASMDKHTSKFAHPSFVDTIRQLTPDEAKLLKYFSNNKILPTVSIRSEGKKEKGGYNVANHISLFGEKAGCENPHLTPVSLGNLERQGLITFPHNYSYTEKAFYHQLKNHPEVLRIVEALNKSDDRKAEIVEEVVEVTDFGDQFIQICIIDHLEHRK